MHLRLKCCVCLASTAVCNVEGFSSVPISSSATQQQHRRLVVTKLETKDELIKKEEVIKGNQGIFSFLTTNSNNDNEDTIVSETLEFSDDSTIHDDDERVSNRSLFPENFLVLLTAIIGFGAVAFHVNDYATFFRSLSEMKANIADPTDFWPAVNFWIFFAVSHAILQPIFWISEILHASPGPKIADLIPVSFLIGNAVVIGAVSFSKEVRERCSMECYYSVQHDSSGSL